MKKGKTKNHTCAHLSYRFREESRKNKSNDGINYLK